MFEGTSHPFTRPAWFDLAKPYGGLTGERDTSVHHHRRRVWDQAFTAKGLHNSENDYVPQEKCADTAI